MTTPEKEISRGKVAGLLAIVLLSIAAILTLKTAFDLIRYRTEFPGWFVPAFTCGVLLLVGYACYIAIRLWKSFGSPARGSWRRDATVWFILAASFICTTSVHGFLPFRPMPFGFYLELLKYPIMMINFIFALLGVFGTLSLWWVSRSGYDGTALLGVTILGFILLIPNDNCVNPFNYWWLDNLGASPLMYLPNIYAIFIAIAALRGVHSTLNKIALAGICLATTLLGLGHMSQVIW